MHIYKGLPGWRIVGFEVVPYSVLSEKADKECKPENDFDAEKLPPQPLRLIPKDEATKYITWSYRYASLTHC